MSTAFAIFGALAAGLTSVACWVTTAQYMTRKTWKECLAFFVFAFGLLVAALATAGTLDG